MPVFESTPTTTENLLNFGLTWGTFDSLSSNCGGGDGNYITVDPMDQDYNVVISALGSGDFSALNNRAFRVQLVVKQTSVANSILNALRETAVLTDVALPLTIYGLPTATRPAPFTYLMGQAMMTVRPGMSWAKGEIASRTYEFTVVNAVINAFPSSTGPV